jgi:hypothetical protein
MMIVLLTFSAVGFIALILLLLIAVGRILRAGELQAAKDYDKGLRNTGPCSVSRGYPLG